MTDYPSPGGTGAILAEIHRMLGDLSAKVTTVLSDMAHIREDVTEHKQEIRVLSRIPAEVADLKAKVAHLEGDHEARLRLLERDKLPKAAVTLFVTVVLGIIGLLTYLGVVIK